jgi:surface antigen
LRCSSISTAHRHGQHLAVAHGGRGASNPYAGGGCTAWAWANRPDLPGNLGDARFWGTDAVRAGFPVDNTPEVGAIAVYQPGSYGAYYPWGHVAVVTAVQGSSVQISEASYPYDNIIYRGRWTGVVSVQFIHRKGAPPPQAPQPSVQFVSPAQGQILSGIVTLVANASNASGVEFDAYYATDPTNINSVGWHKLGVASNAGGTTWSMPFDTRSIPNQGNAGWGTVNVVAIPLDGSGNQTAAPDYRLVTIENSTPPPPPPATVIDFTSSSPQPTTVNGTITLSARYPEAGGIEFDAYYATDPNNINTTGWHALGRGTNIGNGTWTLGFDTHAIPTQGNVGWGTVNLVAIVVDGGGHLTATRYYWRVTIVN